MLQRGPNTDEGRLAVRQNAVKHGISALSTVIVGVESEEEWSVFEAEVVADYQPEGALGRELTQQVAQCLWRKRRVIRAERDAVLTLQEGVDVLVDAERERRRRPAITDFVNTFGDRLRPLMDRLRTIAGKTAVNADDAANLLRLIALIAGSQHDAGTCLPPTPGVATISKAAVMAAIATLASQAKVDAKELFKAAGVHLLASPESRYADTRAGTMTHTPELPALEVFERQLVASVPCRMDA